MAVMRSLVANGFGFGIANIRPHSDFSPDGRPLCFVPLSGALRPMQLGLIMPKGASSGLTISAFIEHTTRMIAEWHPAKPP
jgi:DNA-binding transcriptional LysR family regulator